MLEWFGANIGNIIAIATSVVATASVIANFTPTQTDNDIVNFIGKVVNFLAAYWHDPDKPTAK